MADLILTQGIDSGYAWPMLDGATPADLTGFTAACQVRAHEAPTAPLLATLTAAIVGSSVVVTWTAEESLDWDWRVGNADVILIDAGRPIQVVWAGRVIVDPVVTNA